MAAKRLREEGDQELQQLLERLKTLEETEVRESEREAKFADARRRRAEKIKTMCQLGEAGADTGVGVVNVDDLFDMQQLRLLGWLSDMVDKRTLWKKSRRELCAALGSEIHTPVPYRAVASFIAGDRLPLSGIRRPDWLYARGEGKGGLELAEDWNLEEATRDWIFEHTGFTHEELLDAEVKELLSRVEHEDLSNRKGWSELLERALTLSPQNIPVLSEYVRRLLAVGMYKEALPYLNQILILKPGNIDALEMRVKQSDALGISELKSDVQENLLKDLNLLIKLTSGMKRVDYLRQRAALMAMVSFNKEALADYDEVLSVLPDDLPSLLGRGQMLGRMGNFEPALAILNNILSADAKNIDALGIRGTIFERWERIEDALNDFSEILRMEPTNLYALLQRERLLENANRSLDALKDINRIIALEPQNADHYHTRAKLYEKVKRYEDELADYTKIKTLRPNDIVNLELHAYLLSKFRRWEEAIEDYTHILEINEDNTNALGGRARAHYSLGEYKEALVDYDEIIELQPTAENFRGRALVYEKLGRQELAEEDRKQADVLLSWPPALGYSLFGNVSESVPAFHHVVL